MKTIRTATIVLACAMAGLAVAQGSGKAALTALYAKMDALTLKRDIAGLKKLMVASSTKDAVFTDDKGKKQTVGEMLTDMQQQMSAMTKVSKSTTHIDSLTEKGTTATASATSVLGFTMAIKGVSHNFSLISKSTDIWTKSGGAWKMKSSTLIKQNGTMDGKPIPANLG